MCVRACVRACVRVCVICSDVPFCNTRCLLCSNSVVSAAV